jgi:hypothetical protein
MSQRGDRIGYGLACGALIAAGFLAGCVADASSNSSPPSASGGTSGTSSSGGQQTQPLVVDVDTNATLVTTPGNGVGVYVEYEAGGQWRISWTCDTNLTGLSCSYMVDVSVASGVISSPNSGYFGNGDSFFQSSQSQLEADATSTTGEQSISFQTDPGAPITVTVRLNAPVAFFFVQSNKVNGGYKGTLTNPLIFQPTTP